MMKFVFLVFLSLLALASFTHAEVREWTNSKGQKISAELVSYDKENATIVIRKKGGDRTFTLPLDTLSEVDHEWLEQWHGEQEKKKEAEAAALAEMNQKGGKTFPLKSDGDLPTAYYVYYPKNFDASKKYPTLIMFAANGKGERMLKSIRQGCDALGWIAVGCDTFKNGGNEEEFFKRFTDLLPHIESNVPHDPDALYMGGLSGGALRAYDFSAKFDRPWKGILAYGGWLGPQGIETETAKKMRVAIVNGDRDKNANHFVERDTELLEKNRCTVKYITFPGGHVIAPPDVAEQALRWIAEQE